MALVPFVFPPVEAAAPPAEAALVPRAALADVAFAPLQAATSESAMTAARPVLSFAPAPAAPANTYHFGAGCNITINHK